ncbi:DUF3987 domain-containing protein [Streptomyces pseudogriseolus]|uniref:DUF3987 domain-containing protein n=1 Tax=Streptomyces pseudogriseolus TaxID=36817 RepID=UPI00348DA099
MSERRLWTPKSESARPWPSLSERAYHGLAGDIVRAIEPHTEADPAALLFTLYAGAGAMIGRAPHVLAGGVEHGARIWVLIVGKTAGGMKGTSAGEIRRVLVAAGAEMFGSEKIVNGLSSAEGLINCVRDGVGSDPDEKGFDEGVPDKRLLVIESEFASVLAQGKREGNTLLPVLRQAWDGGTLQTLTVNKRIATDPHIVVVGHITPAELRVKLSESERAGGTANRFLPVLSKRSKLLPDGGGLPEVELKAMGANLAEVMEAARGIARMERTPAARDYWHELYPRLAADHAGDGPVAQVIARAPAQMLRLSVTAALLDGSSVIDLPHLEAAEAMWSYAEDSAWYLFGGSTGNPDLDRLKAFVDHAGDDGASRKSINWDCFGKHRTAAQIDALVTELLALGGYEEYSMPTGGRPVTRVRRTKRKQAY